MASKPKQDDLTKIEGIGPKIQSLLRGSKVDSFEKLAETPVDQIRKILKDAGGGYQTHDPSTWPEQASLASSGEWEQFEQLKQELHGGRRIRRGSKPQRSETESTITVAFHSPQKGENKAGQPFVIERILSPEEANLEFQARRDELQTEMNHAQKCADALWDRLAKLAEFKNHITGISVRFRTRFGLPVSPLRVVIAVNVERKLSPEQLKEYGFTGVDACIADLPIDLQHETKVLEGRFGLLGDGFLLHGAVSPIAALPFDKVLVGGVPIHRPLEPTSAFGTLGLVSAADGRSPFGLSAQHVVGNENDVVEQIDHQGNDREIGAVSVAQQAPFDVTVGGVVESIDAALVELRRDVAEIKLPAHGEWARAISHTIDAEPPTTNSPPIFFSNRRIAAGDKGRPVWKFGNGTGFAAIGAIDSISQSTNINGASFKRNFSIEPFPNSNSTFVKPGDSGSVVATQATSVNGLPQQAIILIGVVFAGLFDSTRAVACNMNAVVKGLGLQQELDGSKFADLWS